jgi:hypothetical protein
MKGGQQVETLEVQFDDCATKKVDIGKYYYVVTVAPYVPIKRNAQSLNEIGGAPNAMLLHIAGGNVDQLARCTSYFYTMAKSWPSVRRFYEYYLQEQWDRFAVAGRKAVTAEFIDPGTPHGRESEAYRAASACTLSLTTHPFGEMLDEIISHMEALLASSSFRNFAVRSTVSKDLQREQRRLWDSQCLLVKTHEVWLLPGILWNYADPNPDVQLSELALSLDEFSQLRDVYIACFEACCKATTYLMAFINTSQRGSPETFTSALLPMRGHQKTRPAATFGQFKRLPNSQKLAHLYEWPLVSQGLTRILDNRLRNSLSHNSVRHDLGSDWIVDGDDPVMSFFEFTGKVYCLNTALQIMMNITHTTRMAVSQPMR